MLLSASAIKEEVEGNAGLIDPFEERWLKPASYVLRLDSAIRRLKDSTEPIVLWGEDAKDPEVNDPEQCSAITIEPGKVLLASTLERVSMPLHLAGVIGTLSHLARCGVSVHCNSFLVSPGFGLASPTPLTLELTSVNSRPIVLDPTAPICHLMLMKVASPEQDPDLDRPLEHSAYEGDKGPEGPKYVEEFGRVLGNS
jgi:dCTP deaminase